MLNAIFLNLTAFLLAVTPVSTYKEGVVGRPASFFSSDAKSQHERTVSSLIYRGLFKYDIYGEIIPDLADTWAISEDGLVYTIKLKDAQYWTDGSKVTSDDLIYTAFTSPDLAGVATDKVDDLTVRYTLPNKYAPFLSLLSNGVMHIQAKQKENALKPVSNGNWQVVAVEKSGDRVSKVVLRTRNEDYQIRKIIFKYYSNNNELVIAAKLGEIDGFLSSEQQNLDNYNNLTFPEQGIYYSLYFNLQDEQLKDLAFREKLQKTLNIPDLIYDKGIFTEGPISRSSFTNSALNFNPYKEGFNDILGYKLVVTVPDSSNTDEIANRIKDVWEDKLGLEVELNKIPPTDMVEQIVNPRNYQILIYGQEVGRDPDRYVNWHSTQKSAPGHNLSLFENVRADRALEEGRNNYENDARKVHYNEFQKAIIENVPAIFLYHPYVHFYVSKYIDGIGQKYTFTQYDRFLDLQNWRRVETN